MKHILFFSFAFFLTTILYAQSERSGKFGIGYSGNLSSSTNAITLTVWPANNFVIEPQIGFNRVELEDNEASMYRIGFGILYNISEMEVLPYIGLRVNAAIATGDDES
jgi:hypothetical protein